MYYGEPGGSSKYIEKIYDSNSAVSAVKTNLFGEDHILFGSDMPYWTEGFDAPGRIISAIETIDLPIQVEEKIFYGNAKGLLNI